MPNASIATIRAGLSPAFKQTFQDGTTHYGFRVGSGKLVRGQRKNAITGLWERTQENPETGKIEDITVPKFGYQRRRPIGEGHSQAERSAQRETKRQRGQDFKAYAEWFRSLTPAEQAFARENKINRPMPAEGFRKTGDPKDALDAVDEESRVPAADQRGAHNGAPMAAVTNAAIDALEPEESAVMINALSADEAGEASEVFGDALRWALAGAASEGGEVHELVQLGKRAAVVIAGMRGDLAEGLPLDGSLARAFMTSCGGKRFAETLETLKRTGEVFGRALEWIRRGATLSDVGERLQQVAYHLFPGLIDGATAATLGEAKNKTRQAVNKLTQQLRDTFAGLRGLAMRGDETRRRCQAAQLGLA